MTERQSKLESILNWTREYHNKLSNCLHLGAEHGVSEQLRNLLDFLEKHEVAIVHAIDHLRKSGGARFVSGDYCDIKSQTDDSCVNVSASFEGLTPFEVLGVVMEQHKRIIERCRHLHNTMHKLGIGELLEELCALEEQQAIYMFEYAGNLQDY